MLLDARALPDREALTADVCIVGAGPAGITLALELAETGANVLLLESGGRRWTLRGKDLARGENADPYYYRLEWTRLRMFGGSSWGWRLHDLRTRPLDPLDMAERPEIDRPGWPIPYSELEPHWARASALCELPSRGFEVADWAGSDAPDLSRDVDLQTVMFPLGSPDSFTRRAEQIARLSKVTCLLNATVLELITDESGVRIDRVWATSGGGRSFMAGARWFVLALGGIENARLLLLSRRSHSRGIGNEHDLVGRYFMEHPHVRTGVVHPAKGRGPEEFALYGRVERKGGAAIGFLRLSDAALRREGLLGSAWALHPSRSALTTPVGTALSDLKATARSYWRLTPATGSRLATLARHPFGTLTTAMGGRAGHRRQAHHTTYRLLGMAEQEPNPDSRVGLGTRRDRHGQPVARLDWRLTRRDLWSLRRTQEVLSAAFERCGIGSIEQMHDDAAPPALLGGGFHHMGTTRMHPDPRCGVVDTDSRVHGMANLFVAGSSVFATGGFANPTLALLAQTLRLGRHLADRLRR